MTLSPNEAAEALSDIARTQGRSRTFTAYRRSAPILMSWGVVWIIGYTAMGLMEPSYWGPVWLGADLAGIAATLWFSRRKANCPPEATRGQSWRMFGLAGIILIFASAVASIFGQQELNVYLAYPGLITGAVYAAVGLFAMPRYLLVSLVVTVATLVGFFAFPEHLALWMAVTGGGGLLVSGALLWKA